MAKTAFAAAGGAALLLLLSACGKKEDPQIAAKAREAAIAQENARGGSAGAGAGASAASEAGDVFIVQQGAPFLDRFRALDEVNRWFVSDGWSNGDWTSSDFRRAQLITGANGLDVKLSANPAGAEKPYSGGEFRTHEKFKYGYFETRMRVPRGSGLITGVFTFVPAASKEKLQEIDIEILGRNTRRVEFTIHQGNKVETARIDLPFDAAAGFHTYGFDWKPRSVTWYIDGRKIHTMRGAIVPIPNRPQQLIIDLWNSEMLWAWAGPINPKEAPWTLSTSCIAYARTYPGRPVCSSPHPNDVRTADAAPGKVEQ